MVYTAFFALMGDAAPKEPPLSWEARSWMTKLEVMTWQQRAALCAERPLSARTEQHMAERQPSARTSARSSSPSDLKQLATVFRKGALCAMKSRTGSLLSPGIMASTAAVCLSLDRFTNAKSFCTSGVAIFTASNCSTNAMAAASARVASRPAAFGGARSTLNSCSRTGTAALRSRARSNHSTTWRTPGARSPRALRWAASRALRWASSSTAPCMASTGPCMASRSTSRLASALAP
mmetsp:Transcript_13605/g.45341  ORF Transcript_13605/g.45341 Transcript_13605/m.45341 type:complete len:236 (+) Transcript_13605:337-1044(+)